MRGLSQAQTARIRYIHHQINKIIYETRFGTIEEVQIDLQHKYFDSETYDIPATLFKTRELSSDGPQLVFPWTDLSESHFFSSRESNNLTSYPRSNAEFRHVVIEKGDRLFISRIDLEPDSKV
jgi:hypothetical protein